MALETLMNERMPEILKIQSSAVNALHRYLHDNGVMQLMPVILSAITDPLCHSVYDASIEYSGQKLQLTKSMILHKQIALIPDRIKKIYIMSPNIRLEKEELGKTGRHLLEFSQLDIELKEYSKRKFMAFAEGLVCHAISTVKDKCGKELSRLGRCLEIPKTPFRTYESKRLGKPASEAEKELSLEAKEPFWIMNHKREFYDREDKEKIGYYHNYDLIWPEGFGEALSGGEREFEYEEIIRKMEERKMNKDDYAIYLEVARQGLLKPSAGGGLGIERFVRYLCGAMHISEVSPFAKVPGKEIAF